MQLADYSHVPRAALASPRPFDVGGPLIESMENFAHRLAAYHLVSPKQLVGLLIRDEHPSAAQYWSREAFRFDGVSPINQHLARSAAELTSLPEVGVLGLQRFTELGRGGKLLRDHYVWCATCLHMWQRAGKEAYVPLLWKLHGVTACPLHQCGLADACPTCGKTIPIHRLRSHPSDHCPFCAGRLMRRSRGTRDELPSGAFRIAVVVGDLLRDAALMPAMRTSGKPDIIRALKAALRPGWFKTTAHVAHSAGISKGTAFLYAQGGRPTLENAARIAVVAGLSLSGLFFPELWLETKRRKTHMQHRPIEPKTQRKTNDWAAIFADAERIRMTGEPVTSAALARRWGVDASILRARLGSEAGEMNSHHRAAKAAEYAKQLTSAKEAIDRSVQAILAEGANPSVRRVAERSKMSRYSKLFRESFALTNTGAHRASGQPSRAGST